MIVEHGPLLGLVIKNFYNALETHNIHKGKLKPWDAAILVGSILTFMNLLNQFKEDPMGKELFTNEQVKARPKRIMTHKEQQEYIKESDLLKLFRLEEENEPN